MAEYEVNQNIINEVRQKLCQYCERRELEACTGFSYVSWRGRFQGCIRAEELYKRKGGKING